MAYKSYVIVDGDTPGTVGEWGNFNGIYLGRNAWNQPAHFSGRVLLALHRYDPFLQNTEDELEVGPVTATGSCTYRMSRGGLLGFVSSGYWQGHGRVERLTLIGTGSHRNIGNLETRVEFR